MVQRKAILVPVDFTEAARYAVRNAIELGRQIQSDVHLINFIPPSKTRILNGIDNSSRSSELFSYINLLRENQGQFSDLLRQMDTTGVTIHSEIKIDKLSTGIKKQFKNNNDIQLMVIGISEAHTIGDFFCKKVHADDCINVECPLLICSNHEFNFGKPHNIVVSLDIEALDRRGMDMIIKIASQLSLNVFYIHVNKPLDHQKLTVDGVANYLKTHHLQANDIKVMDSNDKEGAILQYAHQLGADFIAVSEFLEPRHANFPSVAHSENLFFVY